MTDCTLAFTVAATPADVYRAVVDVRGWWSEHIDGATDQLGAVFTFRHEALHRSTHEITTLEPGKRVVWRTLASHLAFVDDTSEWNDTEVVFEIVPRGDETELRFTHVGLGPARACYGACSAAWRHYVTESLRDLITTGLGTPERLRG